jgi:chemotaxis response regulator CheB
MPESAIASKYIDFILPPEEIAKKIIRIAQMAK